MALSANMTLASQQLSQAIPSSLSASKFVKSPSDTREYDTFKLENGIEAVVVSDPTLSEVAVSLTVGVGQFHDPKAHQGLAHFLEHMIFQGSKAYPEPNQLMDHIKRYNGVYNATTEMQQTNYFFSINDQGADKAINMLVDAIAYPIFKETNLAKEVNAVDQEWHRNKQQDMYGINRVVANTVNPEHPISGFGSGNKATLNNGDKKTLAAMKQMHKAFYSSNLMKLVVVGNSSTAELKNKVQAIFNKIPNKNKPAQRITLPVFTPDTLQKEIFVKTNQEIDSLLLQFPISNNFASWESKPYKFINHLLSSQEEGSFLETLQQQELINNGGTYVLPNIYGQSGTALIELSLTEKGAENKQRIIATFFEYIELIKKNPQQVQHEQEFADMLKAQFENYLNMPALRLAVHLSRNMTHIPAKDIMHFNTRFTGLEQEQLTQTLNQFSPEKMRIFHFGNKEEANIKLRYADASYRVEKFTPTQLQQLTRNAYQVNLPAIEQKEEQIASLENSDLTSPAKVIGMPGAEGWLVNSTEFADTKQGMMAFTLESPLFNQDVKSHIMTNLLLIAFQKDTNSLTSRAQRKDQINTMGLQDEYGNLFFSLFGKTKKQNAYATKIIDKWVALEVSQSRLKSAIKQYEKALKNLDKQPLPQQAAAHLNIATKASNTKWDVDTQLNALQSVTLKEINAFHKQTMSNLYLDVFAMGYFDAKSISKTVKLLREKLGDTAQTAKPKRSDDFKVNSGTITNFKKTSELDNVFFQETFIYPESSDEVNANLAVLNKVFSQLLFNSLRTEKQMGYMVTSQLAKIQKHPAFYIALESNSHDLVTIKKEVDSFILGFYKTLQQTPSEELEQIKSSVLDELQQKPENLFAELTVHLNSWHTDTRSFDSRSRSIKALKQVSKASLVKHFKEILLEGKAENILIQIQKKDNQADYYSYNQSAVSK